LIYAAIYLFIKEIMNPTHIPDFMTSTETNPGYLTDMPAIAIQDLTVPTIVNETGTFNRSISHPKVLHQARSLARRLLGLGPRPQARVALIVDRHLEFIRYFIACRYAGLVPIRLAAAPRFRNRFKDAAHLHSRLVNCRAEIAIASDAHLPILVKAAAGLNLSFYGGTGAFIHLPEEDIVLQSAHPYK
jgi:fatty-acyl-CoA synthase